MHTRHVLPQGGLVFAGILAIGILGAPEVALRRVRQLVLSEPERRFVVLAADSAVVRRLAGGYIFWLHWGHGLWHIFWHWW